jgi:RecA/RadA recombinase
MTEFRRIVKKEFSLGDFKKEQKLDKQAKFKKQEYIDIVNVFGNTAFYDATGVRIPKSSCIQIQGHTDTGKSTLLFEIAYSCQKQNIIPIFVITELKFSFDHLKLMGVEVKEIVDESTGEVTYDGDFIYMDRSQFDTIETMGEKILNLLELQEKGKLKADICFLVDSLGVIESELSKSSKKSNNEWDAGAMSRVFGKSIMPRIDLTKTETYPHTATLVAINQVWVRKGELYGELPKQEPKGGTTFAFNSKIRVMFGQEAKPGISKLKIKYKNKEVTYATRTRVSIIKNHDNGISLTSKIIATPHGFIADSEKDVLAKAYFKKYANFFMAQIGGGNPDDVEFTEEESTDNGVFSADE